MHNTLVSFLSRFANSRVTVNRQREYIFGILNIYKNPADVRRRSNCVSFKAIMRHLVAEFSRLQTEHNVDLSFTEKDLINAIGSFQPVTGSGAKPYIVMTTPEGKVNLSTLLAKKTLTNQREQNNYLSEFVSMDSDGFDRFVPVELSEELLTAPSVN